MPTSESFAPKLTRLINPSSLEGLEFLGDISLPIEEIFGKSLFYP